MLAAGRVSVLVTVLTTGPVALREGITIPALDQLIVPAHAMFSCTERGCGWFRDPSNEAMGYWPGRLQRRHPDKNGQRDLQGLGGSEMLNLPGFQLQSSDDKF